MLPNSLTKVPPFALVFSTHLPVSVCGTGGKFHRLEAFLGSMVRPLPPLRLALVSQLRRRFSLSSSSLTHFHPLYHSWAGLPRCVPPSLHLLGSGLLTGCPSTTPSGLALGPTNPTRIDLPSETLDFRRTWFSHVFRYSCLHSLFCTLQRSLRYAFPVCRMLPYRPFGPIASVPGLAPLYFPRRTT
jgi:hypothetical protein